MILLDMSRSNILTYESQKTTLGVGLSISVESSGSGHDKFTIND